MPDKPRADLAGSRHRRLLWRTLLPRRGGITQITYPNNSTNTFTYNALDTRVGKVDSGGTKTYKRDGAGVTDPVLSDGTSAYTPGVSFRNSGATTFQHGDRMGTTSVETNAAQTTTATRTYDAFGMPLATTGSSVSPFGYAGKFGYQEDPDSSLKLLGHRYYDPSTGRFLTRDPAKDGRNWYAYCENRPTVGADPAGHDWDWAGYWAGVAQTFKGEAEAVIGVVTGPYNLLANYVQCGYRDPWYVPKAIWASVAGLWDDVEGAWNGDCESAGRLTGYACIAVAAYGIGDLAGGEGGGVAESGGSGLALQDLGIIQHGHGELSANGPPGGVRARFQGGNLTQVMAYDGNGDLAADIDWGHDHGAGDPHLHVWGPNLGPGLPFNH